MSIVGIFITLIIVGVVLYLVNSIIPMAPWMHTIINALAAILVLLWLLQVLGIFNISETRNLFRPIK